MQCVYILLCADSTYYTGCCTDIRERLERHARGYIKYTQKRLPVRLVFYASFEDEALAFEFEKYLKTGSGIAFRNARLIRTQKLSV